MPRINHGTAQDAIDYALDVISWGSESGQEVFLRAWRDGDLAEWPDFYEWLDERRIAEMCESSGLAEHIVRRSYMESVR